MVIALRRMRHFLEERDRLFSRLSLQHLATCFYLRVADGDCPFSCLHPINYQSN